MPQSAEENMPKLANNNISAIGELVTDVHWVIATGNVVFPVLFVAELIGRLGGLVRRHGGE